MTDDIESGETPIPTFDNPAGRLAWFFREMALPVSSQGVKTAEGDNRQRRLLYRFGQVLNFKADDPVELYRVVAQLFQANNDLEQALHEKTLERYLPVLSEVRQHLQQYRIIDIDSIAPIAIPHSMLMILDMCSDELSDTDLQSYPKVEDVRNLHEELDDFISFVRGADIDPELASFLLGELHTLADAVDQFYLIGTTPARNAVAQVIGLLGMNERKFEDTEESRNAVRRFSDLLSRYSGIMYVTATGTAIGQTVMTALQSGGHH